MAIPRPADAPPVVLIHGLAGSSIAEWYRVGRLLAADHRVVLVDNRSHGLSPQSRTRFEVEAVADEVASILDTLGIATATVVGYSMGGTIAKTPKQHRDGSYSFYFSDPDGNLIQALYEPTISQT